MWCHACPHGPHVTVKKTSNEAIKDTITNMIAHTVCYNRRPIQLEKQLNLFLAQIFSYTVM